MSFGKGVTVPAHIGGGIKSATLIVRYSRCALGAAGIPGCTWPPAWPGATDYSDKAADLPSLSHRLKTPACFPLNFGPIVFMLQCNKRLDLEAFDCTTQNQPQHSLRTRIPSHGHDQPC